MTRQNRNTRQALRLFSILLRYPQDEWLKMLPDLMAAAEEIGDPPWKTDVDRFCAWALSRAPIELQERYTAAFDLNPATSLDLTYHAQGDSEDRGRVLSRLNRIYSRAGYRSTTAELPDHMPLVLEFLSCDAEGQAEVLSLCGPSARDLAENLQTAKSPYAGLVRAAAEMMTAIAGPIGEEKGS